jgi:MGT family glycosyltransferase
MTESIVVVCMGGLGHVQILLPLIAGLRSRGCVVHVMTHGDFKTKVESSGAFFVDLFARRPLEAVDATSIPFPSRFVTFAGVYAESVSDQIGALAPALIVYDTFTVVGPVVARRLGVPYVNVCPNHAPVPARMLAALHQDPRIAISPECWAAARRLEDVHGMSGANPFSYYETLSPYLNVYCEPSEFLDPDDRAAFEPMAFFGSLAPPGENAAIGAFPRDRSGRRIYVSFGTGVWRYFETAARSALTVISRTLADRDVDVLISLGHHRVAAMGRTELQRPNVRVVDYVDQWATLEEADCFITHHGINSTHESIFHEVPMISYPFFGDQPALARRCQELGLAAPLAGAPQAPLTPEGLLSVLARLADEQDRFAARLAEARSWELRTIASRGAILDRILSLTSGSSLQGGSLA